MHFSIFYGNLFNKKGGDLMGRKPPATAKNATVTDESEETADVIEISDARLVKLQQRIKRMKDEIKTEMVCVKECREIAKKAKTLAGELNGTIKQGK